MIQKYVRYEKNGNSLLGRDGSDSYVAAQGISKSGLEEDLRDGWVVKYCWEDTRYIVFILEKP